MQANGVHRTNDAVVCLAVRQSNTLGCTLRGQSTPLKLHDICLVRSSAHAHIVPQDASLVVGKPTPVERHAALASCEACFEAFRVLTHQTMGCVRAEAVGGPRVVDVNAVRHHSRGVTNTVNSRDLHEVVLVAWKGVILEGEHAACGCAEGNLR